MRAAAHSWQEAVPPQTTCPTDIKTCRRPGPLQTPRIKTWSRHIPGTEAPHTFRILNIYGKEVFSFSEKAESYIKDPEPVRMDTASRRRTALKYFRIKRKTQALQTAPGIPSDLTTPVKLPPGRKKAHPDRNSSSGREHRHISARPGIFSR